jgi:hypothetical protein
LLLVLAAAPVLAQTGGLAARVTDADGEPLPGVRVTISNDRGLVRETTLVTDREGRVEFPVLRPGGGYTLEVVMSGLAPLRIADLRVRINASPTIPVRLTEELLERVQVTARRDLVDLEETRVSSKFSDSFMQDLPVQGRMYQNLLTLAPGVHDADSDGNPTVHGSRSRDFRAEVDGISNVDPLTGQWMSRINPNAIEEIEIITAGAGVEFGRAQGGFARIVQKQGSNDLEGVVDFLWRSSRLDGTTGSSRLPSPGYDYYQPGFQLSGPIVKDRLWFRLSHEWIDGEQGVDVISGVEVVSTKAGTHSDQVTWQASPRNKLALEYRYDPYRMDNFGVSSLAPAETSMRAEWGGRTHGLAWTSAVSPTILVQSRVAWQDLNIGLSPSHPDLQNGCVAGNPFLQDGQCWDLETDTLSGSYYRTHDDHRQRLTVRSDATFFTRRFWGASHQVKAGFLVENERYFRDLEVRPSMDFFVVRCPIAAGQPSAEDCEPTAVLDARIAVPAKESVRATGTNWALYVEDRIRPMHNLAITAGLRVDREEILSEGRATLDPVAEFAEFQRMIDEPLPVQTAVVSAFTAFENSVDFTSQMGELLGISPDRVMQTLPNVVRQSAFWQKTRRMQGIELTNTNISPFLGLAWDPGKNGKTKLAFAAGRHYNNLPLNVPLIELEPATADVRFNIDPRTRRVLALGDSVNPGVNVMTVDHDLRTPYQDELLLSFERELARELSLRLTYVRREYRDQLQDVNLNRLHGDHGRCRWATVYDTRAVEPVEPGDPDYDPELAPGDGILDDCVGIAEVWKPSDPDQIPTSGPGTTVARIPTLLRPDGIVDLYLQNPGWGDIMEVGNYNRSDYSGLVAELIRRRYRNWEMQASYTWSRSVGDGEDYLQQIGDDSSLREDERGYQSDDRRHFVKVNATTITPWGFRLGAALSWRTGLPYSVLARGPSSDAIPPTLLNLGIIDATRIRESYVTHRRNDQRNAAYWNLDLKVTREMILSRGANLQLSAELFNALDDRTYTIYNPYLGIGREINGTGEAYRRWGRTWQLGFRAAF